MPWMRMPVSIRVPEGEEGPSLFSWASSVAKSLWCSALCISSSVWRSHNRPCLAPTVRNTRACIARTSDMEGPGALNSSAAVLYSSCASPLVWSPAQSPLPFPCPQLFCPPLNRPSNSLHRKALHRRYLLICPKADID